jgi:cytochrome c peroxidase
MKIGGRSIAIGVLAVLIIAVLLMGFLPVPAETPAPTTPSTKPPEVICSSKAPDAPLGTGQTRVVHPGDRIQAAVDQAQAGDTIQIMPGTFHEEVHISVNNLILQGIVQDGQRPVLDGGQSLEDGIVACADHVDIENLVIQNYTDNGVVADNVTGVVFRNLLADHTGEYAFFPVRSTDVTVDHCVATGASDTGIYVGQSSGITVSNSEAYANVSGIEIENSSDAVVTNNYSHGNTAGILLFVLPDLSRKVTTGVRVSGNRVIGNNLPNFGNPQDIVARVPAGTGIALIGTSGNEVTANEVRDNNSTGIAVVSLQPFIPERKAFDIDTEPRANWIHDNTLENNGTNLAPSAKAIGLPGEDLLWDGSGWGNSWHESAARRFPPLLPDQGWSTFARRIYARILDLLKAL